MAAKTPTYPVGTIAKLLMLSDRRVQQLAKEGVIPRTTNGRYELAPAVQGYIRYLQDRTVGTGKGTIDFHMEKARLTKAQADMAEIELAKARQDVAPVAEFERATASIMTMLQVNMLNIPQRVVTRLLGETDERKFKKVLAEEIRIALETSSSAELELDDEINVKS